MYSKQKVLPKPKAKEEMTSTRTSSLSTHSSMRISKEPKLAYSTRALDKQKKESIVERLSSYIWEEILCYCIDDLETLLIMCRVCRKFYQAINERKSVWVQLIKRSYKKELSATPAFAEKFENKDFNIDDLISFVKTKEKERSLSAAKFFMETYAKLFQYGNVKENIASKLIEKLKLRVDFSLNKSRPYYARFIENHPFNMKIENNFTHILMNIPRVQEIKFDVSLDQLELDITFRSVYLRRKINFHYILKKKELYEQKKSTKAFHYYPVKNFLFVYFDNDNKVLYMLYEISALEIIKGFHQQTKKVIKTKGPKKLPPASYPDLEEFIKEQPDYEIHLTIQNHKKTLFTFVNTKVYPDKFDKKGAYLHVPIGQRYSYKNSPFKLDDEQGINEILPDFFIADVIFKDTDNILVMYSGFFQAQEIQRADYQKYLDNYFSYMEDHIRVLALTYQDTTQKITIVMIDDTNKKDMLVSYIDVEIYVAILKEI